MRNSYMPERYWNGGSKLLIIIAIMVYGLIYHLVFSSNLILFSISTMLLLAAIYIIFSGIEMIFNQYENKENKVYTIIPLVVTVLFSIFLIYDGSKNADKQIYENYKKILLLDRGYQKGW